MAELKIAKGLSLPAEAVTQTFAILARRGAGKTYAASVMAEEMLDAGNVIVWLDPLGAAWGLRSKYPLLILGGAKGDLPLEPGAGKVVADFVVSERVPVILDLSAFGEAEMQQFVAEFLDRLYRTNTLPVHLFADESDEFAPQDARGGGPLWKCLGAMQRVVRRGRIKGIGTTLITQRSAVLNKSVLTQTECLIAMQTTAPQDLKAIDDWIKFHGTAEERDEIMRALPSMQQGEAYVYSPGWLRILQRVKIRERRTHDSSRTPKPGETRAEPRKLADVDLGMLKGKMAETIERAKADDPKELKRQIAELRKQLAGQKPVVDESAIARAVEERDRHWKGEFVKLEAALSERTGRLQQIERLAHLNGEAAVGYKTPPPVHKTAESGYRKPASRNKAAVSPNRAPQSTTPPDGLAPAHHKILNALAWLETTGITKPSRGIVAAVAGVSPASSSYANNVSRLSSLGLVEYPMQGLLQLSDAGRELAEYPASPPTIKQLHESWRRCPAFAPAHVRILDAVIAQWPDDLSREELAEAVDVSPASSSFANNVSRLSSLGLIKYPGPGRVEANPELLFPEGVPV